MVVLASVETCRARRGARHPLHQAGPAGSPHKRQSSESTALASVCLCRDTMQSLCNEVCIANCSGAADLKDHASIRNPDMFSLSEPHILQDEISTLSLWAPDAHCSDKGLEPWVCLLLFLVAWEEGLYSFLTSTAKDRSNLKIPLTKGRD